MTQYHYVWKQIRILRTSYVMRFSPIGIYAQTFIEYLLCMNAIWSEWVTQLPRGFCWKAASSAQVPPHQILPHCLPSPFSWTQTTFLSVTSGTPATMPTLQIPLYAKAAQAFLLLHPPTLPPFTPSSLPSFSYSTPAHSCKQGWWTSLAFT